MNRILKFKLPIQGVGSIKTKGRPNILSVGYQDVPVIWVDAREGEDVETFFYVALTGDFIADGFKYVGTATNKDRDYVVHIFKEKDSVDNFRTIPLSEIVMR